MKGTVYGYLTLVAGFLVLPLNSRLAFVGLYIVIRVFYSGFIGFF